MTKTLDQMNFSDVVDEAASLVLTQLMNGKMRDGVADAVHLSTRWQQERLEKAGAKPANSDEMIVSRRMMERTLDRLVNGHEHDKTIAELKKALGH